MTFPLKIEEDGLSDDFLDMYIEQGLRSGDRVFIRSALEVIAGLLQNDANDDWVKTIGATTYCQIMCGAEITS